GERGPAHPGASWVGTCAVAELPTDVGSAGLYGDRMTTPPGWYADPARRHQYRYWNGQLWTDHVSGPQGTGTDPLPPAPQQAQQQVQPAQQQAQDGAH